MKRILFGIDSYFQLILAINLRITVYKNEEADIIIYNSVPSADKVVNRLRECQVFQNVWITNTSLTKCGNKFSSIQKLPKYLAYLLTLIVPKTVLKSIIKDRFNNKYDEFIFNGFGALPECIFNSAYKNNNNIKCKRIEDGYMSYITVYLTHKSFARKVLESISAVLFNRKNINNFIDGYYLEDVNLCVVDMPYPIIQAPKVNRSNKQLVEILNKVFDYNHDPLLENKQIFLFEDGRHFFSGSDEEMVIISEIAKRVGKDNIVVKMHPRRTVNRWATLGIDIIKSYNVPWELIQLNNNCSGKFFLTVSSAVVFSSSLYFGDNCKNILLYKCLRESAEGLDDKFDTFVKRFMKIYGESSILIPKNYDELMNYIIKEN